MVRCLFCLCFFIYGWVTIIKKTETGFSFFVRLARKMMRLFKLIHFILCSFHKGFLTKGLKIQFTLPHVHKLFSINFISMALVTCPATFFLLCCCQEHLFTMHFDYNQQKKTIYAGIAQSLTWDNLFDKQKINQIHTTLAINSANINAILTDENWCSDNNFR